MLLTALVVFALNPASSGGTFTRAADALTSSFGLWFNVGTGMPEMVSMGRDGRSRLSVAPPSVSR